MRTVTTAALAGVAAAIVGVSAASGCYGATEISIAVTTTVSCSPSSALTTQIFTGPTGTTDFGTAPAAETVECGSSEPRIGTLSVVPSGARDGQFDLEVVGAVGVPASDCRGASLGSDGGAPGGAAASSSTGCIVARRRVSFRPHKNLMVPVLLSARCIGVPCGVDQTCDLGICTSTVDCTDQGCPRERGDVPAPVADASADAPTDAPVDAPVDASVDASASPCGTSPEVVISGQAIVGQLAMEGGDFVYVNATTVNSSEIRRVPRAGAMTAQVVDTGPAALDARFVAVAASGADLAWATEAPGPQTTITSQKLAAMGFAPADQASLAISGQAVVGFWRDSATAQFEAFGFGGTPPSVAVGAAKVPGTVPEVLVDDKGDFYGVSGGTALVHYKVSATSMPVEVGRLTTLGSLIPDIAVAQGRAYVASAATDPARGRGVFRVTRAAVVDTFSDPAWISIPMGPLPQSMTSDGAFLYYVAGTALSRADLAVALGAPGVGAQFASTGPSADRLQVDKECVYWVEGGTTIMKRAKQ